ncbi:MAG: Hsp70 family protein [Thermoanaerobaculia bacterium]|nr:Hsp70 family protein [Thermoanaerobaculia bacterium]
MTLEAQQLLDLFIRQLRERAERGVPFLRPEVRHDEGLNDRRVVFRNAAFSHPVDVSMAMKGALMRAAHSAGINEQNDEATEFFDEWCIDEATAAVLAYAANRLGDETAELSDLERVLCFDVGGGTTDLAAVELRDMARFHAGDADVSQVTVELCAKKGDSRFGGDRIDQLLAKKMLEQVEQQSREHGSPVVTDEVLEAILAPSFAAFQDGYRERLKHDPRRKKEDEVDLDTLYRLASGIVEIAEKGKCKLSTAPEHRAPIDGALWPRAPGGGGDKTKNFEIVVEAAALEAIAREELGKRLKLLEGVVSAAGWEWSSVTTFLFTGQSMRSPILRQPVLEHLRSRLGEEGFAKLHLVEPGENGTVGGFDPKLCVAIGAAIWGMSRTHAHPWLLIQRPLLDRLSLDLRLAGGPGRFLPIEGLERGAPLPVKGKITFPNPRTQVTLYSDRKKLVEFHATEAAREFTIEVESLGDFWLIANGKRYRGELVQ